MDPAPLVITNDRQPGLRAWPRSAARSSRAAEQPRGRGVSVQLLPRRLCSFLGGIPSSRGMPRLPAPRQGAFRVFTSPRTPKLAATGHRTSKTRPVAGISPTSQPTLASLVHPCPSFATSGCTLRSHGAVPFRRHNDYPFPQPGVLPASGGNLRLRSTCYAHSAPRSRDISRPLRTAVRWAFSAVSAVTQRDAIGRPEPTLDSDQFHGRSSRSRDRSPAEELAGLGYRMPGSCVTPDKARAMRQVRTAS